MNSFYSEIKLKNIDFLDIGCSGYLSEKDKTLLFLKRSI
jgi:hypothetical protein